MKLQDIFFLSLFIILIYKYSPRLSALMGIIFLLASIPLFYLWIFFTAERFTWYAVAFFLMSIFFHLKQLRNN